jgi:hypothetical protein
MWKRRLVWTGVVVFVGFAVAYVALHFIPVQPCFTLADYERIKMGMTIEEVEAILGSRVPDEQSILSPTASKDPPPCWKAWGDKTEQLHVHFDARGRVDMWVVQPIRPTLIYHVRGWLWR